MDSLLSSMVGLMVVAACALVMVFGSGGDGSSDGDSDGGGDGGGD